MQRDQIKAKQTFRTKAGRLVYVHELVGQKVTFSDAGSHDRIECSLGRFASRIAEEVPNEWRGDDIVQAMMQAVESKQ